MAGIGVVQAFTRGEREPAPQEVNDHYRQANQERRSSSSTSASRSSTSTAATVVARLRRLPVLRRLGSHSDSIMLLHLEPFRPIQQLSQLLRTRSCRRGSAALDKIVDVLDAEPSSSTRPAAQELRRWTKDGQLRATCTFSYGRGPEVLHGLDLDIAPDDGCAGRPRGHRQIHDREAVGARFYDPREGAIDGHDLRDVTQTSLRRQLGIVPEGFLFAGTVTENIAFGGARGRPGGGRPRRADVGPRLHPQARGRVQHM